MYIYLKVPKIKEILVNLLIPLSYDRFYPYSIVSTEVVTSQNIDDVTKQSRAR